MLFSRGFNLRKWSCSNPAVLETIPDELKEKQSVCALREDANYIGVEWNTVMDHFRLKIAEPSPTNNVTIRLLVAKTFDVLGGSLHAQSR